MINYLLPATLKGPRGDSSWVIPDRYLIRGSTKFRARLLDYLAFGERVRYQSQTFTSGTAQTGDDGRDDWPPEITPGFVFTVCHRIAVRSRMGCSKIQTMQCVLSAG